MSAVYSVYVTETVIRRVNVLAESHSEAERRGSEFIAATPLAPNVDTTVSETHPKSVESFMQCENATFEGVLT